MAGASTAGYLEIRSDPKVFVNGDLLIGFTTSFRMGQLLMHPFKAPENKCKSAYEYMVTTFIDAVRNTLKSGGYQKTENEVDKGGTFIVAYRGQIYKIEDDYQVAINADDYCCVGSGAEVACGALFATWDYQFKRPQDRVRLALKAAENHNAFVRHPFTIRSIRTERGN